MNFLLIKKKLVRPTFSLHHSNIKVQFNFRKFDKRKTLREDVSLMATGGPKEHETPFVDGFSLEPKEQQMRSFISFHSIYHVGYWMKVP